MPRHSDEQLCDPVLRDEVALREGDDLRQAIQARAVAAELRAHGLVVGLRIALRRIDLDEMDEEAAALHVGEELVAEPGTLGRSLDQPGDVRDHELAVVELHGPEVRLDGGEGVVGDLRGPPASAAPAATTCRRSGSPTSPTSASSFSRSSTSARLPSQALLREARRLPGRRREALVAVAAAPRRSR